MKDTVTFEQAVHRIEEIIKELETAEADLEQSLVLYAESAELLAFCDKTLKKANLTIEKVFPEQKGESNA